jgi:hypothetical protein
VNLEPETRSWVVAENPARAPSHAETRDKGLRGQRRRPLRGFCTILYPLYRVSEGAGGCLLSCGGRAGTL